MFPTFQYSKTIAVDKVMSGSEAKDYGGHKFIHFCCLDDFIDNYIDNSLRLTISYWVMGR